MKRRKTRLGTGAFGDGREREKEMINHIIQKIITSPQALIRLHMPPSHYCVVSYHGHPKGCPNFDKCDRCPPKVPLYKNGSKFIIVAVQYNLAARAAELKKSNPTWSERQCRCCLYWQGTARKVLRNHVRENLPGYEWEETPEARGAHVFRMMSTAGYIMDKQAKQFVWKVAFIDV